MESPITSSPTISQRDQLMVEMKVAEIYQLFASLPHLAQTLMLELQRDNHMEYLTKGLKQLGPSYCVLDANRPWLCYWILHSIALLGDFIDCELENDAVDFLNRCQDANGGYAGGPAQLPHLATTYAAVNSLVTLGGERALSSINREKLHAFLLQMKDPSGGFRMHDAGEMDVRACYTAISVASVLDILDDELVQNVGNYILSCQTYEGGIAGEPGSEAHGGYTFCGLATMILINEAERLDLPSLLEWVVFRQGVECGFQGRINKLVDGCYSFWQGGVCALMQRLHSVVVGQLHAKEKRTVENADTIQTSNSSDAEKVPVVSSTDSGGMPITDSVHKLSDIGFSFIKGQIELDPLFHSIALQQYILLCSQGDPSLGCSLVALKSMIHSLKQEGQGWMVERCSMAASPSDEFLSFVPSLLSDLLLSYAGIFEGPLGLLLSCAHDHGIPLKPGTEPINVCPYWYPLVYKDEIERLVKYMLHIGIIQHSFSPFSSPVLLVKKDGSWRFCVDYRALNQETVPDHFSIPVIDELIDELHEVSVLSN